MSDCQKCDDTYMLLDPLAGYYVECPCVEMDRLALDEDEDD